MKLEIPKISGKTNWISLIQWLVFILILAVLGWCFWYYYDINDRIEAPADMNSSIQTTINKSKLEKVQEMQEEREVRYNQSLNINYDPFQ